jgi:hypothetical protein
MGHIMCNNREDFVELHSLSSPLKVIVDAIGHGTVT